jgi:HlyD family secretion protein
MGIEGNCHFGFCATMIKKLILLIAIIGIAFFSRAYLSKQASSSPIADTLYGNVDIREVSTAFRVAGRVADVNVDEGASVKAGEVLARLDDEPFVNGVHAAEASLAALTARNALLHKGYRKEDVQQAKAKLQSARAALLESERHLARQKELIPEAATTQHAVDAAQSMRDQASAMLKIQEEQVRLMQTGFRAEEIAESDAQLKQAQANLDVAKLALSDTTLKAPSEGIILTRAIEKGSMLQAGMPAFSLSLTKPVWVRAYVAEPQLGRFASGTKVSLFTDSRPDKPYHGVVGFVSPAAEFTPKAVETTDLRTSLVYRLRIVVEDADSQLRQGMPVTVRLGA